MIFTSKPSPAVGLDISNRSVRFLELVPTHDGLSVGRFAHTTLPEGIIEEGRIVNKKGAAAILSRFRNEHGISSVRAAFPEKLGHVFTARVPDVSNEEIESILMLKLDEYVPRVTADATVDFDEIVEHASGAGAPTLKRVAVSVYPRGAVDDYASLLADAGLTSHSLEMKARGLARSVVPSNETRGCMVVDIGDPYASIAVVVDGSVRFTAAVPVGSGRDSENLARDLAIEIDRYYLYWWRQLCDDPQNRDLPAYQIKKIFLCGDRANVDGLPEYITRAVRVDTARANAWANVLDPSKHTPPLSYGDSLGYASAIGLALGR